MDLGFLRELEDDWDGRGSGAVCEEAIGVAERIVSEGVLMGWVVVRVNATGDDGVVCEFRDDGRESGERVLLFEIGEDGDVGLMLRENVWRPRFLDVDVGDLAGVFSLRLFGYE